jgi:RimJ/RimL family protein N-acetyltransferase
MTITIETERLMLRPFEATDWQDAFAYASDPEITQYTDWNTPTQEQAQAFVQAQRQAALNRESDYLPLALKHKLDQKVIGDVGIKILSRHDQQGEVGWTLHKHYQNRGLATEAVTALLTYGFETFHLHRIIATCDERNVASIRLMERVGMRREAHFKHVRIVKGAWSNEYVYAILADEWKARHS